MLEKVTRTILTVYDKHTGIEVDIVVDIKTR